MKKLISKLAAKLGRPAAFMLLPLSLLPLTAALPLVANLHADYARYYDSPPLSAPSDVLSAGQRASFKALPAFSGAVPVLVYYAINNNRSDSFAVSQRRFAQQLAALKLAGYQSISIAQYDRFQHGQDAGLPARPVLITFDGGRFDSYRGADNVLKADGFKATMFVVTGDIAAGNPAYLTWTELHRMQSSGRWDIQPESFQGDVKVTVNPRGQQAPYYAMPRYLRSSGQETFAGYQLRVSADLFTLASQFQSQGIALHAIAVPFGDYGQLEAGNNPRVVPFILSLLKAQFSNVFVQNPTNNPPYTRSSGGGPQERFQVTRASTTWDVYKWLWVNNPSEPRSADSAPLPGASASSAAAKAHAKRHTRAGAHAKVPARAHQHSSSTPKHHK